MSYQIKNNIIKMTKLAFRPFRLIINNNVDGKQFTYSNGLFKCDIDLNNKLNITSNYILPALHYRTLFGNSIIDANKINNIMLEDNNYFQLEPTRISNNKKTIEYVSNGIVPEEYARMIVDFGKNQHSTNFEYIIFNNSTNNYIEWMSIFDTNMKNISNIELFKINFRIERIFNNIESQLIVLDKRWITFDNNLSNFCNNFRLNMLKNKLISLNYNLNSDDFNSVNRYKGGLNVSILYNSSHYSIVRPLEYKESILYGENTYYSSYCDNTNCQTLVHFNEILKKHNIESRLIINNKIIYDANPYYGLIVWLYALFEC